MRRYDTSRGCVAKSPLSKVTEKITFWVGELMGWVDGMG